MIPREQVPRRVPLNSRPPRLYGVGNESALSANRVMLSLNFLLIERSVSKPLYLDTAKSTSTINNAFARFYTFLHVFSSSACFRLRTSAHEKSRGEESGYATRAETFSFKFTSDQLRATDGIFSLNVLNIILKLRTCNIKLILSLFNCVMSDDLRFLVISRPDSSLQEP